MELIAIEIALFILLILVWKYVGSKRIEVDWERGWVFGWYKRNVLVANRFNTDGTPESIQAVKDKTKKELNDKIKIFNQIK
jgi:hypothetical protein